MIFNWTRPTFEGDVESFSNMKKEIDFLRSVVTEVKGVVTEVKGVVTEVQGDLRILHPLPYARLHFQKCIDHQIACNEAVNAFIDQHTLKVINMNSSLSHQLQELKRELKKAWDARFAAAHLCEPPPTLESILWIVAKSGFTREVAPFMNCSNSASPFKR
jgi:hypothetical protein